MSKNASTPLLETVHLNRNFGEPPIEVRALTDINFDVKAGEFSALIGPSGSGKSTLLQLLGGLDKPSSGNVIIDGKNIEELSNKALTQYRRDNIGFIFQSYNLIPVLSAAENIEYIMLLQDIPAAERRKRTSEIMNRVGLNGLEHRRPNALSGGQQQRVAVARAMVSHPKLILADEPTANLDSKTGHDLIKLMEDLNHNEGMTFLFSTHDQKVMDQAHRLIYLEDGKIVKDEYHNKS